MFRRGTGWAAPHPGSGEQTFRLRKRMSMCTIVATCVMGGDDMLLYISAIVFGGLGIACFVGALRSPPPRGRLTGDELEERLYRQAVRDAELRRLRRG